MIRTAWLSVLVGTVLTACGGSSDSTDAPVQNDTFDLGDSGVPDTAPLAEMRVVNLTVGEGAAKLYIDSRTNAVLNGLDSLTGSPWRQVNSGMRTFRVGPEDGDEEEEWARTEFTLEGQERYSLVIFGSGDDIRLLGFPENARTIPEGEARYTFLNASADLDPFDVLDVGDTTSTLLTSELTFGAGPTFVDAEEDEREIGVDLDRDGTAEATFTVPEVGREVLPVYFLVDEDRRLVMAGQAPQGKVRVQESKVIIEASTTTTDTGM